jgi:hypothetical protein
MIFCDKEEIKIISDVEPHVCNRLGLPSIDELELDDILKKPFISNKNTNFFITYKAAKYQVFIPKNYKWDGATIPFGVRWIIGGKGNPKFLVASCVHDRICECPWLVHYNRYLSSLIFKELLIACGCGKIRASIMFAAVETAQKFIKKWKR